MRYLKKVSVTSNNTSGKIIDSLISGDNPQVNAPSIKAVTDRVQAFNNNLLFNADFICNRSAGGAGTAPTGWDLTGAIYAPSQGLWLPKNTTPVIKSPLFMPTWFTYDYAFDFPFTVSAQVLRNQIIEEYTTTFNTFAEIMSGKNLFEIYDNVYLTVKAVMKDNQYCLQFAATGAISSAMTNNVYIARLKAEKGSKATPFIASMRDYSLISAITSLFDLSVAGLKVFEFDGTLPANTSGNVTLTADTGYNLAILAAYAYNNNDSKYYEMAKPDVVGATYYRPTIYCLGNQARIDLDSQSVTAYASQAYKVYAIGWKAS